MGNALAVGVPHIIDTEIADLSINCRNEEI